MSQEDPKILARDARRLPETEKILKQFCSLESGNYATAAYRKAYDRMKSPKTPLTPPRKCLEPECSFVAETMEDLEWHEEQCGHEHFEGFANTNVRKGGA